MQKTLFASAALISAVLLAGCSTPPPEPKPAEAVPVHFDKSLDPVHVREPSAEFYAKSRAGAALREEEASHVLWNAHYEANAADIERIRLNKEENERMAKAVLEDMRKAEAEAETASERQASEKVNKEQAKSARKNGASRDKSIYAGKDRSIYIRKASDAQKGSGDIPKAKSAIPAPKPRTEAANPKAKSTLAEKMQAPLPLKVTVRTEKDIIDFLFALKDDDSLLRRQLALTVASAGSCC